jgi:agmatinase
VSPFPGAVADRDDAAYVLVGAPLDATTTFQPGTRFGPGRVRRFAETFDDYDRRTDAAFTDLGVHDAGDLRAWDDVPDYLHVLRGDLYDAVTDGAVPLTVGGEHTVTAAGLAAVDPDVAVVVDAHLDLRDAYDGNPWSHACALRRALDGGPAWDGADDDASAGTAGVAPDGWPPSVDRLVVVGARTGSPDEWARADAPDVTVVPPAEAADWAAAVPADDRFADESVYLSVDVDGVDPGFAPGTGTMEPFGLTPHDVRAVVRAVAPRADGCDVVEVNDRDDGQAAALGGKLLREFVYAHADARADDDDA